jgi:hypothetical protein
MFGDAEDFWIDLVSNEVTIEREKLVRPSVLGKCFAQRNVIHAWYMSLVPEMKRSMTSGQVTGGGSGRS